MKYFTPVLLMLLLLQCKSAKEIDARYARNRNAAGKLEGKTVVYTVFVDSKETYFWSGFDLQSTKDSLNKVFAWVRSEGKRYGKNVDIQQVYAEVSGKPTFKKKFPFSSLNKAMDDGGYSKKSKLGKWANSIVKKLEKSIKLPNGEKLPKKPKLDPFGKLVTKLKKKYEADNVVIFFMLNNYFVSDGNVVLNSMTDEECEFAINTGKNTNFLAVQFLSLFGAQNLTNDGFSAYAVKNIELAKKDFPKDVMIDFESDLAGLNIGGYTAYLLGWKEKVDPKYAELFKIERVKKKKNENGK